MKNVAITLLMMLFVGVGSSMAQDKKAADTDTKAKTEVTASKKECSKMSSKECAKKCAKSQASAGDKKACAPGCEKACCMADAGKKEEHDHDSHDGHSHPH